MKRLRLTGVLRVVLGLVFTIFGPNHYLQFIHDPPRANAADSFLCALTASRYVFEVVVAVEIVSGVLLLTGVCVPFALVMLAPIIVNIFFFHMLLDPGQLPIAAALVVIEILLAWQYRTAFAPLFQRQMPSDKERLPA